MSSTRCPGSAGSEEVRLRDGICGARDLFFFHPEFLSYLQDFSQVLASIRVGSWGRESRGRDEGVLQRGRAGGGKGDGAGVRHTQLSAAGEMERKATDGKDTRTRCKQIKKREERAGRFQRGKIK